MTPPAAGRRDVGYTLRAMQATDLAATLDLAVAFYKSEGFSASRAELARNLARLGESADADVRVAVDHDGTLVGFAATTTVLGLEHSVIAELQDLYVDPRHRRAGVAAALIDAAKQWAARRGARVIDVVVDADGDERHSLTRFYAQHDFVDARRRLLSAELVEASDS